MNRDDHMHENTPFAPQRLYSVVENEKVVEVLNALVQINNDRIDGYENAAEEAEDIDLKILFNRMMTNSKDLKIQLINEVIKYGGEPTENTSTIGKVFRTWMDFKAIITGKDRKAILESCEFGEEAAQETYEEAINNREHLPTYIIEMILGQKIKLRDDLNFVKFLQEKE